MNLGAVFDVAVGLAFTYFVLALIASGVQEVLAAVFSWRGTYLSKAVGVIIDNDRSARFVWDGARDFLRAHFTPHAGKTVLEQKPAVSPEEAQILGVQTHPLLRNAPSGLPSYVPAKNFALAMLDVLRDGSKAPLFVQAENTVSKLPDGDLKRLLTLFLVDSGGDIDKFRERIEGWFDQAMDRAGGIYKRWAQYVLLAIGIAFAISLNVDSLRVARTLWVDSGERATLVAEASKVQLPTTDNSASFEDGIGVVKSGIDQVFAEGLPIGWTLSGQPTRPPAAESSWIATIIGWLITGLAVGLGAPFWFSMVQNLTNIRSSGPPPKAAPN